MVPATAEQIAALRLDPGRPLIVCDVDEVAVHFLRGLEAFLDRQGLWLDAASFALNGNIRHRDGNAPLEEERLGPLLMQFFADHTHELEAIDHAADSLNALAAHADVVMLTNIPRQFRDQRVVNLAGHGLHFPVVTNSGPKGPALAALAGRHLAPVVFLDDHTGYLQSAAEYRPDTTLVHFMQDARFARHAPAHDFIALRTGDWREARRFIAGIVEPVTLARQ